MTRVINIRHLSSANRAILRTGTGMYIYVGRSASGGLGPWGNKYSHLPSKIPGTIHVSSRMEALLRHKADVDQDPELQEKIKAELRGSVLVCWCRPQLLLMRMSIVRMSCLWEQNGMQMR